MHLWDDRAFWIHFFVLSRAHNSTKHSILSNLLKTSCKWPRKGDLRVLLNMLRYSRSYSSPNQIDSAQVKPQLVEHSRNLYNTNIQIFKDAKSLRYTFKATIERVSSYLIFTDFISQSHIITLCTPLSAWLGTRVTRFMKHNKQKARATSSSFTCRR